MAIEDANRAPRIYVRCHMETQGYPPHEAWIPEALAVVGAEVILSWPASYMGLDASRAVSTRVASVTEERGPALDTIVPRPFGLPPPLTRPVLDQSGQGRDDILDTFFSDAPIAGRPSPDCEYGPPDFEYGPERVSQYEDQIKARHAERLANHRALGLQRAER